MIFDYLIPLIAILPLIGFVVTAVIGRRLDKEAHWIPVAMVVASWAISMLVAYSALTGAAPFGHEGHDVKLYQWIPAGSFVVNAGFFVDNLTACLLIVVTTIGMLVHIYSIGYMAHDSGRWRFFAYLNLFMFSMLLLVLADNFVLLFAAWELVGLSSYLLIGFWYSR
ncbi:MAG: NADH-quinone oxidoreductase subunit L, partial [Chloroflexota bacterium]